MPNTSPTNNIHDNHIAAQQALLKNLQESEREKIVLLSFSHHLSSVRDKSDLEAVIRDQLRQLFKFEDYLICTLDDEKKVHTTFFNSPESKRRFKKNEQLIYDEYPAKDGVFELIMDSDEVLVFNLAKIKRQKKILPPYLQYKYDSGCTEAITMALRGRKGFKGAFFIFVKKPGTFKKEALRLLKGLSTQLAISVANIMANEKIEKQLKQIERYKQQLEVENIYLQEEHNLINNFSEIIGESPEMQQVFKLISQVAYTDSTVLILGETGTGKELVAKAIHNESPRKDKLMIKVNCASMPPTLIESELFGHEKGSFTGAVTQRIGKFELAHNGTLFLDEIGELPIELQVKLLRVLQEKEIERIGGKETIKVNARIVVATNRNLQKEVLAGRFRGDLFYRLNVFPITLPPLRTRINDVPLLAAHFINKYARQAGRKPLKLSPKVSAAFMVYHWPGNIRELQHLIERSVLLTSDQVIHENLLPGTKHTIPDKENFQLRPLADVERDYILKVIKQCKGKISGAAGAAAILGLRNTTLISKMEKLGIKKSHFVDDKIALLP